MRKKNLAKKILAVTLAGAAMLSLGSCGSSDGSKATEKETTAATEAAEPETTAAAETEEPETTAATEAEEPETTAATEAAEPETAAATEAAEPETAAATEAAADTEAADDDTEPDTTEAAADAEAEASEGTEAAEAGTEADEAEEDTQEAADADGTAATSAGWSSLPEYVAEDISVDDADELTITYWLPRGEDSSFYSDYEDNPVVKYIENNYVFNGKKLHFEYYIAPPGSESDDFSTLIGTGDYCGVMDMSKATVSQVELYEDEMIWDLTDYVAEYMPNYNAFLESNPDVADEIYSIVDGEKKILSIYGFSDGVQANFQGLCYRRDWIAKYGANPETGEAFTYGFADENDPESWEDNVVFPNGTGEPLYISDWEWMFEIFEKAMADQGIEDGYCYSPYYLGYMATGDIASGFGGGGPDWYDDNGTCVYGITTDNFRAYLQCLNTWYQKGWIDTSFAEHTNDMFFAVDAAKVFQGKVGLWQGRQSTVGTQIDAGDAYTAGAVVFGCRQPINDIYGGEEQQNKEPDMMYQFTRVGQSVVLTDKLDEEGVITFLKYVDFLYSKEGALLRNGGLSKEQYEECQDEFYTRLGLTDGLYYTEEENGAQILKYNMDTSLNEFGASNLNRIAVTLGLVKDVDQQYGRYLGEAIDNWGYYLNTAALSTSQKNAVSVEDSQTISQIKANLDQFLARSVSAMVKGSGYDIWDDASWEQFIKDVNKYQASEVTAIYQAAMDLLK